MPKNVTPNPEEEAPQAPPVNPRAPGTIVGIPTEDGQLRNARKIPWQRQDVFKASPTVRWFNFTGITQAIYQGIRFDVANNQEVETPDIIRAVIMDAYHARHRKEDHFKIGMKGTVEVGPLEPRT